jgi:hypothetical protein
MSTLVTDGLVKRSGKSRDLLARSALNAALAAAAAPAFALLLAGAVMVGLPSALTGPLAAATVLASAP